MNILIVPKVIEKYKNQIEISVEINLLIILSKIFFKCNLFIFNKNLPNKKVYDLIILSGGNTISKFSKKKKDLKRSQFDNEIYKKFITKVPIIGICHGMQYLMNKTYKIRFVKTKKHCKEHLINCLNKKFKVNSFHNYKIFLSKSNKCNIFALADDNSIESFYDKKRKIAGVMWHPERSENKYPRLQLIKKIYDTISSGVR